MALLNLPLTLFQDILEQVALADDSVHDFSPLLRLRQVNSKPSQASRNRCAKLNQNYSITRSPSSLRASGSIMSTTVLFIKFRSHFSYHCLWNSLEFKSGAGTLS